MKHRNSRKEIDKEKMFSRLMPTFPVLKNDDQESTDILHNITDEIKNTVTASLISGTETTDRTDDNSNEKTDTDIRKSSVSSYTDPQTQALLRSSGSAAGNIYREPSVRPFVPEVIISSGSGSQDAEPENDDIRLINIIEYAAMEKIRSEITKSGCCSCQACRDAVTLKVLNALQPEYIYTSPSRAALEAESRYSIIEKTVTDIILEIKEDPPH